MGNSKFHISKEAKDIIDSLKVILNIEDTPVIVKLALAKGIATLQTKEPINQEITKDKEKWLVPENIIKDRDYLLFKHLIINEYDIVISDKDINKYFAYLIERGARELQKVEQAKTSFEDIHVSILS